MKKFRDYITEEVVPTALVKDGSIDLDKEDVRASINMALAKVTADGSITPYIALNRISKALSMFHIILPKRVYLEGGKGVEVHELRQFGNKMGMTDAGEFVNEVPGKFFLFIQYGLNTPMNYGGQYAYPTMGGTFRVVAKVVDQEELNKLLDVAEITMAEEAEVRQLAAKAMAPKEDPHTALGDCDCSQGDSPSTKKAIKVSMKKIDEDKDPCWKGYEMIGMKKKGGRKVPNCVPVEEAKKEPVYTHEKGPLYGTVTDHGEGKFSTRRKVGMFWRTKSHKSKESAIAHLQNKKLKEEQIDEKAPPGAKFECMVKHIKKGYSKDGLTKKEKSIAYATAWKAKKREESE